MMGCARWGVVFLCLMCRATPILRPSSAHSPHIHRTSSAHSPRIQRTSNPHPTHIQRTSTAHPIHISRASHAHPAPVARTRIRPYRKAGTVTTSHDPVCRLWPPARPQSAGPVPLVIEHGPDGATSLDIGSSLAWASWTRATSMRPRESEGKAKGLDEDDDGAVRSGRSGPQSWARASKMPVPMSGPRSAAIVPLHHPRERQTTTAPSHHPATSLTRKTSNNSPKPSPRYIAHEKDKQQRP
ncbi:hypothetical protein LMG3431_02440 [Achromobacter pestifer]|uniref:Uncharacterized protein n=1 Tax=Achromobacter pestifer TaxID=1353889 RepID=A0A6S6ZZ48_9BURK|nr:hypothetical protein LMG3431_02440 [Achromobacter pestifer]